MKNNKIQFAVVREDPLVEGEIIQRHDVNSLLLIASGGCTAFSRKSQFPDLRVTLVDQNPAQIDLVRKKMQLLSCENKSTWKATFNVGDTSSKGLNACGNFESLFRCFREFISEFILEKAEIVRMFSGVDDSSAIVHELLGSPYWPVAFNLHFHDTFLNAIFGPDATQHAPAGSYPGYFRNIIENGLKHPAMQSNYFLHHIFLGYYMDSVYCLPVYLRNRPNFDFFELFTGRIDSVGSLINYDMISLSNILDIAHRLAIGL